MFLSIRTTHRPATDLGFLLRKNPERSHTIELAFGSGLVFYPEAREDACTAALLVEIDPVELAKRHRGGEGLLAQYVNDRPYAASSLLAVAISEAFGSAMNGRSRERPELAQTAIPLEAHIPALPSAQGPAFVRELFEPLGYEVQATAAPLDPAFPEWGPSRFIDTRLRGTVRLMDLLRHLYVLIPALDAEKHYWIGEAEVEKLLEKGADWLPAHPKREVIARRYLRRRASLASQAVARLAPEDPPPAEAAEDPVEPPPEPVERLWRQRRDAVVEAVREAGARRVLDLGCGEGRYLRALVEEAKAEEVLGVDVSPAALSMAEARVARLPQAKRARVRLAQGSATYADARFAGFDAALLVEVIEHLELPRLESLERVVFERARPGRVVVTTPNADYNSVWENLSAGAFRHGDHRFEWSRAEFREWCEGVCARRGYRVELRGIGAEDAERGTPTQMGVFDRCD
ncbi:MAG: 3' terminal RNA ribose 2'-O-methyltransferase Hen1 [Candidatus Sumerlaeia bacterium]|nr:3' terminal RNA ribose 2'-O-methyltransferase Hen1 [Candidatus Sumerlaeia bacterium]